MAFLHMAYVIEYQVLRIDLKQSSTFNSVMFNIFSNNNRRALIAFLLLVAYLATLVFIVIGFLYPYTNPNHGVFFVALNFIVLVSMGSALLSWHQSDVYYDRYCCGKTDYTYSFFGMKNLPEGVTVMSIVY